MKNYTAIAALLWLTGFCCALMPLTHYEAQSFALAFLFTNAALFFSVAGRPAEKAVSLPRSLLLAPALVFWALALFSVFLSEAPYVSLTYFCFFSVFPLSLLTVLLAPDRAVLFKICGLGLAMIYAALALVSLAQFFFQPDMLFEGRTHRPLADPGSLGGLYSLGFFGAVAAMFAAKSRLHSNVALILAIVIAAALFTTGSRGAMAALLGALAVFLALNPVHVKIHRRCTLTLVISSVVVFIGLSFLTPSTALAPSNAITASIAGQDALLWSRPQIWASSWQIMKDHFWSGTGIGTFFLYYPEYRSGDVSSAGLMAHSDPVQFAVEMGVFAPLLFYSFIILALITTARALRRLPSGDVRRVYITVPFCALGAMIVHTHITFHFYTLSMLMAAGLLLGFWFFQVRGASEKDFTIQARGEAALYGIKFAALAPLMVLLVVFFHIHGSYLLIQQARQKIMAGDVQGFAADVNRADMLSHHKNERAFIMAAHIPLGILQSQGNALGHAEMTKLFDQGYGLLQKAYDLNPRLAAIFYYRAQFIEAAGYHVSPAVTDTPEDLLQQALRLDPLHIGSRLMLAGIYQGQGKDDQAYEVLKDGMKWTYAAQNPVGLYEAAAFMALARGDREMHALAMRKMLWHTQKQGKALSENPMAEDFRAILPSARP